MSSTFWFGLVFISGLLFDRPAAYTLTMSPEYLRTNVTNQPVTFTCTADVALTRCQFSWFDHRGKAGPVLDLSQGSESREDSTHHYSQFTRHGYSGRGLGAGDCGITMQVKGFKEWMVGCRVRAETGGWTYAWADFLPVNLPPLTTTLTPRQSVVLPGGEARFALWTQEPLSWCHFYLPGLEVGFNQVDAPLPTTGRHLYLGAGLEAGECGLKLTNVSKEDNGPVRVYIGTPGRAKLDYRFMALIVARPPGPPALSVVYTDADVTATCVVQKARPVANISWVLGDDPIHQGSLEDHSDDAHDKWRWPWMKGSITQTLTLRLKAEDNCKVLKCVVTHVALDRPLEATEIISFTEPSSEAPPVAGKHLLPEGRQ